MTSTSVATAVVARKFSWTYAAAQAPALTDLSCEIPAGSITLLVGHSGSGKSTLGAAIAGLLVPGDDGTASGALLVGDTAWSQRARPVGVVLQQPDNQTILHKVGDDVAFGPENMGVEPAQIPRRVADSLAQVGLDLPVDHSTSELSGGMRQRLALAGAMAMRPGVIVLDEALQALDAEGTRRVVEAVADLHTRTGVTVIIVDHDPGPWKHLFDQVVELESGRLVGAWPTDRAPIEWHRKVPVSPSVPEPTGAIALEARALVIGRGDKALPGEHSLVCQPGDIVALMGPNGSGKSTLLLTLAGLVEPVSGEVVHPPQPHRMRSQELSRHIALVPQNPDHHQVADTVREDLASTLVGRGLDASTIDTTVDAALARYGLSSLAGRHPATLSGGEARRLALAGAVVTGAPVIILDEPSQSLDRAGWSTLVEDLRRIRGEGTAVILATHDEDLARALGARVYDMPPLSHGDVMTQAATVRPPWTTRANPLSLVAASTIVAVGMLTSLDVVSGAVSVFVISALVLATGLVTPTALWRLLPIVAAAFFTSVTIALYGHDSGSLVFQWWVVTVTSGSLGLALATALRILAIGIPAVILFRGLDATALADALSQRLRLPERFVIGALASARLVQLLGEDYRQLRWSRRSRGLGDTSWWASAPRLVFSILVIALRRASILATAMEARGFGRDIRRTHYRQSRWRGLDTVVVVVSLVVVALSLGSAVALGAWSP